ncbi:hypothetical protein As57867_004134, partial [Aphanomyces stellatus]
MVATWRWTSTKYTTSNNPRKSSMDKVKLFMKSYQRLSLTGGNMLTSSNSAGKNLAMETGSKDKHVDILFRLTMNCSEFFLVGLLLGAHIWLNVSGLWNRQTTTTRPPDQGDWATVGTSCFVTASGFQNCSVDEANLTTPLAWTAIGQALATQMAGYMNGADDAFPVSTCVMGSSQGYGSIVLLVGDVVPPFCVPSAPEPIFALSVLETAMLENATVQYLLSTYIDDLRVTFEARVDTDGTHSSVSSNVTKQLISPTTGQVTLTGHNTTNWRFDTTPLLPRYQFHYSCASEIVRGGGLWASHGGIVTNAALAVGWTCSHHVDNRQEVSVTQYIALAGMLHLFSGDVLTTLKGVQGVLLNKPVLTYDFISSLERRKVVLFLLIFFRLGSVFYLEVCRLYHRTASETALFFVSSAMACGLYTLAIFWPLVTLQHVPSVPIFRGKVIRLYAPILHVGNVIVTLVLLGSHNLTTYLYNPLWQRPQSRWPFWVQGHSVASGVYDEITVAPCIEAISPDFVMATAIVCALSLLYPLIQQRKFWLDTNYFHKNEFLSNEFVPNYVTFLPLYETECIKYGSKLFAKASTLALFGYAIIEEEKTSTIEVKP